VQVPRSTVERYAHWLTYQELAHICAASKSAEQHARLCSRVLMRTAIATCLGEGIRLSVRLRFSFLMPAFCMTSHMMRAVDCSVPKGNVHALKLQAQKKHGIMPHLSAVFVE
jgi:hypothetical protein